MTNRHRLDTKGSSYRQWQAALVKYSESQRLQAQKAYWEQTVSSYEPLPEDKAYAGEVLVKDIAGIPGKTGKGADPAVTAGSTQSISYRD